MTTLFQRRWFFQIGGLDVSELDADVEIKKTIRREPNTCTLTVYNLSESSRSSIGDRPFLQVKAGYSTQDPIPTLFSGETRKIEHSINGLESTTVLEARDSGREYRTGRISRSYGPRTAVDRVLFDAIDAMGVGQGNVATQTIRLSNGATVFADGYVAHGAAHRVVNDILRGAGYRWSVQNGAIQVLRRGRPLQATAVELKASSGLLGSPSQGDRGIVTAVALLQPGLEPGRRINLQSQTVTGGYEVRSVVYRGSTYSDSWEAELELRPES